MRHNKKLEYSLSHIAVFHLGTYGERQHEDYTQNCRKAADFSIEQNLKTVFVNTNLGELFYEEFQSVCSFRKLACALALQGLFSICFIPSMCDVSNFKIDIENSSLYDLLTIGCASTESLSIYLSGSEISY